MGTQFWWFYDVLIIAVAGGLIYNAAAKGFNKLVFRLIGCVLAFAVGCLGSWWLSGHIYNVIFQEECIAVFQTACEEQDLYVLTADYLQENSVEGAPDSPDKAAIEAAVQTVVNGEDAPDWLVYGVSGMLENLTAARISPLPDVTLAECFFGQPEAFRGILAEFDSSDRHVLASGLEQVYIRPDYVKMVGISAFLILEAAIAIIVGIISASIGNKEELMHVRKLNRPLAVPVGLVEAAAWLFTITAAVRLMVSATDNMMMLFNEETIEKTLLFKYIFHII